MGAILTPVIIVSVIGILAGGILVIASKYMSVPVDERVKNIRNALPGVNCGACGFAGCDEYAEKLVEGGVKANLCPPGGVECVQTIDRILGTASEEMVPMSAIVKCSGSCDKTGYSVDYQGPPTCESCSFLYKGRGMCQHACLGYGDCERACTFDAIYIQNGIAVVDKEKCTGCTVCVKACPKALIEMIQADKNVFVACSSKDKGGVVRKLCAAGCIGCKLCLKACKYDAIAIEDNLARIIPEKCTNCKDCVEVCPTKAIKVDECTR